MARLCFFYAGGAVGDARRTGGSKPAPWHSSQPAPWYAFHYFFPLGFEEKGRIHFYPRALSCSWALWFRNALSASSHFSIWAFLAAYLQMFLLLFACCHLSSSLFHPFPQLPSLPKRFFHLFLPPHLLFPVFSSLLVNTSTLACLFCGDMNGEAEKRLGLELRNPCWGSFINPESPGSHRSLLSPLDQIGRMIKRLISLTATDSWYGPA